MKRSIVVMLSIVLLACMLASCNMDTVLIGGSENTSTGQPINPSEPEEPEQVLRRPYISFFDFINPGIRSAAIIMTTPEDDASIYYTTDGSTPSPENGREYAKDRHQVMCGSSILHAVSAPAGSTVKAVTYKDGVCSDVATLVVPSEPTLDPPAIHVRGETSGGLVIIAMKTNDSSAQIHYTTDGTTPTRESRIYQNNRTTHVLPGTVIVSGVTVGHGCTVKAFAYSTRYGMASEVTTYQVD